MCLVSLYIEKRDTESKCTATGTVSLLENVCEMPDRNAGDNGKSGSGYGTGGGYNGYHRDSAMMFRCWIDAGCTVLDHGKQTCLHRE